MSQSQRVTIKDIQRATCSHFRVGRKDLLAYSKFPEHTGPRQMAMFLSRKIVGHSYPVIAREFDRLDHVCVMHAVRKIEARVGAGDELTLDSLAAIKAALRVVYCKGN